jgi:hypothetical protein
MWAISRRDLTDSRQQSERAKESLRFQKSSEEEEEEGKFHRDLGFRLKRFLRILFGIR